jgi:nucleolar GTP-binding protein
MEYMDGIVKKFPNIDSLPEIYTELIRLTLDYDYLKKSLGALTWVNKKLNELSYMYLKSLKACETKAAVQKVMSGYYGRISSLMRQVDKNLKYIEDARRTMKNYPTLKTDLYTVAITGFPNIGKSTLLSKLTTAKPEIKNYAFTTKQINQGYAQYGLRKVQFVDTPGVLNRDKMNNIELQAYLVLKYLVNLIIYVIDLTEPYPLKKQEELLKSLKDHDKPIIVYLSKTDILPKEVYEKAKKKYKAVINIDDLNKKIEKNMKEYYFES